MMRRRIAELDDRGFTIVEVLIASMILLIALLSVGAMFPQGYKQVADAGRMTIAVTAARQILEDLGALPFGGVANLNGYTTTNLATVPTAPGTEPEQAAARRWAYMAAGSANGFVFTTDEMAEYGSATPFGGQATIQVCDPGVVPPAPPAACPAPANPALRQATVTVSVPGLSANVQLTTMLVRMF
jgi:prepilin-type N-terminal cleavage/methylation domain-containing protein